jgi:hypothetical protein
MKYSIKELKTVNSDDIVFEVTVESHFRTLNIDKRWYHLNLPKMTFLIGAIREKTHFTWLYLSNRVVVPTSDEYFIHCPLPNIIKNSSTTHNGLICLGGIGDQNYLDSKSLVENFLTIFYTTSFRTLDNNIYDGPPEGFYQKWQKDKRCPIIESRKASYSKLKETLGFSE